MWIEFNNQLINLDHIKLIYIEKRWVVLASEAERVCKHYETKEEAIKEYEKFKSLLLGSQPFYDKPLC